MRIIIQRSKNASVKVADKITGQIESGLVVFVGFTEGDTKKEIEYLADKIINLRIFDDENGVMNKSLLEVGGSLLSVSQFTLYADARKGRRPSYANALKGELAIQLYQQFNEVIRKKGISVEEGIFGADMQVELLNDGPVTILLEKESENFGK